jgi:hypothetical protein
VQLHCATCSMHLCNTNISNVNRNYNSTGISTGGVAEVFEKQEGVSEAIILKSRKVCPCCGVLVLVHFSLWFHTPAEAQFASGSLAVSCLFTCLQGVLKLAIRTGAPLVPCFLFGNTKL